MLIETETTPNPATLKFLPGRAVMDAGTRDFATPEEAEASPLAEALFDLVDVTGVFFGRDFVSVTAVPGVDWRDLKPDVTRLREAAGAGFSTATDLADWLVRELRLPFRDAHHVTGRLVAKAEARSVDLSGLSLDEMQAEEPRIHNGVFQVLSVEASVASRTSYGGTAPVNVRRMAAEWRERLA